MGKEASQLTEKEALSIFAKMMHTLDSYEFESFLSEDFRYSSQKVLTNMNSKDEFIEYIRPKIETIKKTKSSVYAELGVCLHMVIPIALFWLKAISLIYLELLTPL